MTRRRFLRVGENAALYSATGGHRKSRAATDSRMKDKRPRRAFAGIEIAHSIRGWRKWASDTNRANFFKEVNGDVAIVTGYSGNCLFLQLGRAALLPGLYDAL
jgi:hypothetical protein